MTACPGSRAHDPERASGFDDATQHEKDVLAAHDADIMLIASIDARSIDLLATPNVAVADVVRLLQHVAQRLVIDTLGAN